MTDKAKSSTAHWGNQRVVCVSTCGAAIRSRWCRTNLAAQCSITQFQQLNWSVDQSSVLAVSWYIGIYQWSVMSLSLHHS